MRIVTASLVTLSHYEEGDYVYDVAMGFNPAKIEYLNQLVEILDA